MSRCIDADALKETIDREIFRHETIDHVFQIIDDAPTIEPKRGKWIDRGWKGDWQFETDGRGNCWKVFECSVCNGENIIKTRFCPNCGADMREREGE